MSYHAAFHAKIAAHTETRTIVPVVAAHLHFVDFIQESDGIKKLLAGMFAAYEGRTSLRAVCRTLPDFMFAMVPMLAVVRLAQPLLGLGPSHPVGWLVFIPMLYPLVRDFRGPEKKR